MTFRKLLVGGNLAALLLIVITAATAIVGLHVASTGTGTLAKEFAENLKLVQQLRDRSEEIVVASRGYLLTGEPQFRSRFETAQAALETDLAVLRGRRLDPTRAMDAAAVERASRAYTVASKHAGDERSTMDDPTALVPYFDATLQPLREHLETTVNAFVSHERSHFDASLEGARAQTRDAQIVLVVAALLAIGIGLALARFVSRRVTAQFDEMKLAQDAARAAAEAREEVLAVVSHDLRNPLQAIVMGVGLIGETVNDDRTQRQIRTVGRAAERMQHMIDELLEIARIDARAIVLRPEPCDAKQLVDETLDLFQTRAAEHSIALRAEGVDTRVVCDRERVLEVLSNLVGNAFKFTPRGGAIVVKAEPREREVRFEVSDTGSGVAPEQVPHLFERFWQGRKTRDGLGLGLYICKQLVEAHHGAIGVDSQVGEGTAVWFTVPA